MTRPIWTIRPDWKSPVVERIAWLTDVRPSRDGTEERHSTRAKPRWIWEFETVEFDAGARELDAKLCAHQADEWLMPLWTDVGRTLQAESAGTIDIAVDTTDRDYRAGDDKWAVLLGSDGSAEAVEIAMLGADSITLADPLVNDWPAGTLIYPARVAHLGQSQDQGCPTAGMVTQKVRFELVEYAKPGSAAGKIYQTIPVLELSPNREQEIPARYERKSERIDFNIGGFRLVDVGGRPFTGRTQEHVIGSRAEAKTLRQRLGRFAGRYREFWCPTWQTDVELAVDAAATDAAIRIDRLDYATHYAQKLGRKHINIQLHGGTQLYAEITGSTLIDGDTEELTLDAALGIDVDVADVAKICWLERVRLASDTIEIGWQTAEVASASLPLRSLR